MAARTPLSTVSSFEGVLAADGTASLQRDGLNSNGGTETPELYSQDSTVSSEESVHGELHGLVPESATESESAVLRSHHSQNSKDPDDDTDFKKHISQRGKSLTVRLQKTDKAGHYQLTAEDPELRDLLKQGFERSKDGGIKKKRSRFSDLVFTRQFTAFDRQNSESASSPFHGFFSLFWMGVSLLLIRISADNWRTYGSIFGGNEIVHLMLSRDIVVMGLTDGVMCASTVFCLFLQKMIQHGYLTWNGSGWIVQNTWQLVFLVAYLAFPVYRNWPWTHSVFITLHCITMLMKQHSYAFYNGHLSELYKRRRILEQKLEALDDPEVISPTNHSPSSDVAYVTSYLDTKDLDQLSRRRKSIPEKKMQEVDHDISSIADAIASDAPLDFAQVRSLRKLISFEIQSITEELKGKTSTTQNHYPRNLTLRDFYSYIPLPTVVYELEYPRQPSINWSYVAEKTVATFGVIGVMIVVSQYAIYPVVAHVVHKQEEGMPLKDRLKEIPWVFSDLLFPFFMEYILSWYVIWECVLNVLAELTLFADRGFYSDWWNSSSWDQFARDWNRPVHNFLLRHVYHSSIATFNLSRSSATLLTFLLSACVHELVMAVIFQKVRGYLLMAQMSQLPLVVLSRTRFLKGRDILGNMMFWFGLFVGPSLLCTLYLLL
ncbi:hypothetical protein GJ744_009338 [Endocarpon pusillum]|uniref:O-acyltransferase n=1 Tax=Endocarpon pusillum TaxID=364733 RepID=A0A8H7E3T9_9EURO|nr:hypothetical protein GJ744_009338 [Endocarpon pusillum]